MALDTSLPITCTITDDDGNARPDALAYCLVLNTSDSNSDGEPDDIDGVEKTITKRTDSSGVVDFTENDLPATHSASETPKEKYTIISAKAIDDGSGEPLENGRYPVLDASNEPAASDYVAAYQLESQIPGSDDLILRISARDDDRSAQSITSMPDLSGNVNDLSGQAKLIDGGINGKKTYRFDGGDDFMEVLFGNIYSQPNHIFAVFQIQNVDVSTFDTLLDSYSNIQQLIQYKSGGSVHEYEMYAGSAFGSDGVFAPDGQPSVGAFLFDGAGSELDVDGDIVTGDPGGGELDGISLAERGGGGNNGQVDIGEILVYPQDKSGIKSDVLSYLESEWGIA